MSLHFNMRNTSLPLLGLGLCLFFVSTTSFAQSGLENSTSDAVKSAEVMPVMLGCENELELEKRKSCTNDAIMSHVMQELQYPEGLESTTLDETVIVEFVINQKGLVGDAQILRGKEAFHENALNVIRTLPPFTPGMENGEPVNVKYALPIRFSISE